MSKLATNTNEEESAVTEVTIFTGSSDDEVMHAKSFWRSLDLQPLLESRLVSSDIRQRLPVAKSSAVVKSETDNCEEGKFFQNVLNKIEEDKKKEIRKINDRREDHKNLLQKLRDQRIKKEVHHH